MHGTVLSWQQSTDFGSGYIRDEYDNWWYAPGKSIQLDSLGRCLLVPGETVHFDAGVGSRNNPDKIRRVAKNILRPHREMKIDPASWREIVMVRYDRNFVVRQVGGLLALGYDDRDAVKPGQIYEVSVEPSIGYATWMAVGLRFIADEESQVNWTEASLNV